MDSSTGTIKLKATFPNAGLKLWPGGFVDVRMLAATEQNVITVPTSAVQRGPQGPYVFVVKKDDVAERRPIKVGHEDDQTSIVTSGLAIGEQVVIDGQMRLSNGARVDIRSTAAQPKAAPAS